MADQKDETSDGYGESDVGNVRENEDGTVDVDIGIDPGDVMEHEDGSATITMDSKEDEEVASFYANLVPMLLEDNPDRDRNRQMLDDLAYDLIEKIEEDSQARKPRDEKYAEGIKRTGLGDEAPGGASFTGASRVAHPMLTQACVDYEARVLKEIFPATGPVKAHIVGTVTKRRQEKATRVARCMNWQLQFQIGEFRTRLERGEMQTALNGASYLYWIPKDPMLRRTAVQLLNIDKVILAAEAGDFYSAQRMTILDDITQMTYEGRLAQGQYYEDPDLPASSPPSQAPDKTEAEKARDKVEGKTETVRNEDGERRVYVCSTYLSNIEEALGKDSPFAEVDTYLPYLVYICDETYKVLGVTRNWEEDDDKYQKMHWLTELPFVPWEESNIGLVHLIGGLAAAATGSLRALLDSAHVNNIPTAAVLKGSGVSGQSKSLSPTQIYEIAAGVGADDIRKLIMPVPYNEPSSVLYQLMTFLVDAGEGVVRTTFEKLSENNTNLPVGTTYALLEQGLTVVSSIMARQHYAMQRAFEVLYRINRMYLDDTEIRNEAGEILAYRSDFTGPMDVVPVSDPNIPSDSHRFAQLQALVSRADAKPELYNAREIELTVLRQLKVAEPERYLTAKQEASQMNAANENMAATLGRPIMASPEQDHIAHLKVHIEYLQSPFFGFLSIIAPTYIPIILDHIKEHLVMWYISKIFEGLQTSVEAAAGGTPLAGVGGGKAADVVEFMKMGDSGVNASLDDLIATVSEDVMNVQGGDLMELQELQVIQVIQKAQQVLEQYKPQMPVDPSQTQLQTAQIRAQAQLTATRESNQAQTQMKVADINERREGRQQQVQLATMNTEAKGKQAGQQAMIREDGQNRREGAKQVAETQRTRERIGADVQMNQDDNKTALIISEAEIASGEKATRSTGGDSSPGA